MQNPTSIDRGNDQASTEGGIHFRKVHDDFELELMEVRTLIDFSLINRRNRITRSALITEVRPERNAIATEVRALISGASSHVEIILAGEVEIAEAVSPVVSDLLLNDSGRVDVRMLCTRATLDQQLVRDHAAEGSRLSVRVSGLPGLTAVIVDGRTALVHAESAVGGRASLIRAESVNRTLHMLFESIWQSAAVPGERIDFGSRNRSDTVQQVLEYLRLGLTDEVAARELSVSVRTYRRYVAEIMTMMDADSRFQAGVRAARLGLLSPTQPSELDRPKSAPDTPSGEDLL